MTKIAKKLGRPGFPYTKNMTQHILNCVDKGMTHYSVWKSWPDKWKVGDTPSKSSIRRKFNRVKHYREDEVNGVIQTRVAGWESWETELAVLAYKLCDGKLATATNLFFESEPDSLRNPMQFQAKIWELQANGKLEKVYSEKSNIVRDWKTIIEELGYTVVNPPSEITYHTEVTALCPFGHTCIKAAKAFELVGCNLCSAAGQMSLTELKNHPLGHTPAKLYCVQFEDKIFKTGHCSMKGIKHRGKNWPPFKILRDNDTILFEARRIEAATHNTGFRIPMYEPLKGNGGTECFEGKHLNKILKVIDEETK